MSIFTGRKIERIILDEASADLTIDFSGAVRMRTFNDSTGFEAWNLVWPDGTMLVAQGGGNVIVFPEA